MTSDLLKGKVKSCGCLNKERELDIVGQRFYKLTVMKHSHKEGYNYFLCKCDCGEEKIIRGKDITAGKVKSCGRHGIEAIKKANTTHGDTGTRLWNIYNKMLARCSNPKSSAYKDYGGRGIGVCKEWSENLEGYKRFKEWALMNGYDDSLSIERLDVNGNYEPENCAWADHKTQNNNKRNTIKIALDGKEKPLSIWCEELGLNYQSVFKRITSYNFSPEEALTKNIHKISKDGREAIG
jgi:hypothetical protein